MFNFFRKPKKKRKSKLPGTYFKDTKGNLYRAYGSDIFSVKIK